jgi:hypothetical protein
MTSLPWFVFVVKWHFFNAGKALMPALNPRHVAAFHLKYLPVLQSQCAELTGSL